MDFTATLPAARLTAGALLGRTTALFGGAGTLYHATLTIDVDAQVPRRAALLQAGQDKRLVVKVSTTQGAAVRSACLKFQDAYGPGRDQDFLLASSGDGAPLHHLTLPTTAAAPALFSSLWLYLAGIEPVLVGLRTNDSVPHEGSVAEFCLSAPIGKFRRIGTVTFEKPALDVKDIAFAGHNSGGNIRPLPPVAFY